MQKTRKAIIGYVITSRKFAYGKKDRRGLITVGYPSKDFPFVTQELRLGKMGNTRRFDAHDESRTKAEYVVERAAPHEEDDNIKPDVAVKIWRVTARRLDQGRYNPYGEVIQFYQGARYFPAYIRSVNVVREMKHTFID